MVSLISYNAYQILGLTGTATARQQKNRANELVQMLKIDEVPQYQLDIRHRKQLRTEDTVKEALRRLQSPRSRLKEYFFWFRIGDEIDEEAAKKIGSGDYASAIQIWTNALKHEDPWYYARQRNIALAFTVPLFESAVQPEDQVDQSLEAWSTLLNSSEFWEYFENNYKLDGGNLSEASLSEYKAIVIDDLSDIYAELESEHGGSGYVYKFQRKFNTPGKEVKEHILIPIWTIINAELIELEMLKPKETNNYNIQDILPAKEILVTLQDQFNKLIDIGLYNNSETKLLRDRAAMALQAISAAINNRCSEYFLALKLAQIGFALAGTESCKKILKSECDTYFKNSKLFRRFVLRKKNGALFYVRRRVSAQDLKPVIAGPQQDDVHLDFNLSFFNKFISLNGKPIKSSLCSIRRDVFYISLYVFLPLLTVFILIML